jgi:hypothetical protein
MRGHKGGREGAVTLAGIFAAVLIAGLLILPCAGLAGAWTQPKGHGQIITTVTVSRAQKSFNASGALQAAPHFRKEDYETYGEYGLTDRLTAILHWRVSSLHSDPPSQNDSGLAEAEFGLRQRIYSNKRGVFSLQVSGFAPAGTVLTSGGFDGELRVLSGSNFNFWRRRGFLDSQVAYRLRANGFANEVRADLTVGLDVTPRWTAFVQSFNVMTVGQGRTNAFAGQESKVALSLVYRLSPKWSVQLGGLAVILGTNVPAERAVLSALWYRF